MVECIDALFVLSVPKWPPPELEPLPQLCVCGRSNVGKSSLLNALMARKNLARTSNTPGRTQELVVFKLRLRSGTEERHLHIVDLPGYGFAKVPAEIRRRWRPMMESYFKNSQRIAGALALFDSRRDPSEDDFELIEMLADGGVPTLPIATKTDKVGPSRRRATLRGLARALELEEDDDLRAVSVLAKTGIDELRQDVWNLIAPDGQAASPGAAG
ncbi:MAG: ribosome biogenesis GTP-binding protein YihA/YsxC [Candidatus Sumerlaeia bacterium]|nr:ribosome biogenesis GTP-binding protein YihA/YsxC [Candidatus Sumerlaeia bacterium]